MFKRYAKQMLDNIKKEKRYRNFINVERDAATFPYVNYEKSQKIIWCTNDYLNQSHRLSENTISFIKKYGIGSGGTRNIGGSYPMVANLEHKIADVYEKDRGLIFNSGYLANEYSLSSLGTNFPNAVFYSDASNHASLINGIRSANTTKHIFRHNDMNHLEALLKKDDDADQQKIIVFQSIYSMDGSVAPLEELHYIAKKYNALTYCDEIHALGLYGSTGLGMIQKINDDLPRDKQIDIDIVMGGFGKAMGTLGGFVAGDESIIDMIRLTAHGFIFTTSLPPYIMHSTMESFGFLGTDEHLKIVNDTLTKSAYLKERLRHSNIDYLNSPTHIIPIMIRDAGKCTKLSNILLNTHNHYIQPINYPTVEKGSERFRLTLTHKHTYAMIDSFIDDLRKESVVF